MKLPTRGIFFFSYQEEEEIFLVFVLVHTPNQKQPGVLLHQFLITFVPPSVLKETLPSVLRKSI